MRSGKAGALIDVYRKGVLVDEGWFTSFRTLESVDQKGQPLPWYTYSFIHFLEPRLNPKMRVFEYGSGNSTRWYSKRVGEVVAVEHDPGWASKVAVDLEPPSRVIRRDVGRPYVDEVTEHGAFDIVVVDGIEELRPDCARVALSSLNEDGVFIWDNSDRPEFDIGMAELAKQGFRSLSWTGLGPTAITGWKTSVIYRSNNCLGI